MTRCWGSLAAAVVVACAPAAPGQDLPKATPEGQEALDGLIEACVAAGGLKRAEGTGAVRLADPLRLDRAVRDGRDRLTPALRDTLVARCARAAFNSPLAEERPAWNALTEAVGRELKDDRTLGYAAFFTAWDEEKRLRFDDAADGYERAAGRFAAAGDREERAVSLNNLGFACRKAGDDPRALRAYGQALDLYRELYPPDRFPDGHADLARALNNLGAVRLALGDPDGALGCHEQALAMRRRLRPADHPDLVQSLGGLGGARLARGDLAGARDSFQEALAMCRRLYPADRYPQGHPDLAAALNNLGGLWQAQGELARARSHYEESLAVRRRLYPPDRFPGGHPDLLPGLQSLGSVLQAQGEYGAARGCHEEALAVCRRLYPADRYPRGHPDLAHALNNLAALAQARGDADEARAAFRDAVRAFEALYPPDRFPDGHPELALALNNLGGACQAAGDLDEAGRCFERSLAACRALYPPARYPQGHPDLSRARINLGFVLRARGEAGPAERLLDEAAQSLRTTPDPVALDAGPGAAASLRPVPMTFTALALRARALESRLTPRSGPAEVRRCERACALAAALQGRLRDEVLRSDDSKLLQGGADPDLAARQVGLCGRLYGLEGKAADLEAAYRSAEEGRARVFLESLGRANATRLSGLPADLADEEERLRRGLRLADAALRVAHGLAGEEGSARRREAWRQRQQAEDDLDRFERAAAAAHPQYAALRYPRPCPAEEARRCLDDDEVALLFAVGTDESFAVVLHKRPDPKDPAAGLAVVRLPGRQALADKVEALTQRERLQRVRGTWALGADLYRDLLGPLAEHIRDKNLVVVPDGPLCLLPFELLVEPDGRYLIENHRVRYAPSMTSLHMIRLWEEGRKERPNRPLAAFGDPVFDPADSRLKRPGPEANASARAAEELARREGRDGGDRLDRLAASGREVRAIGKLLRAEAAVRTDEEATEALVKKLSADGDLRRVRYVHFATHGVLGLDRGQSPALVLTLVGVSGKEDEFGLDDGLLTLPEVSALKLNADLVVLSACRTGQGRMHNGEGVSGLARVFLYAGSRGVVCSLWSVDDEATAEFMTILYQRLEKGDSAAEALRAARLALIADGQPPLVWAPFVLMGR
jgi:CHAT domain-containing protein